MRIDKKTVQHYRELVGAYQTDTGETEINSLDVVRWGMAKGKLELSPAQIEDFHRNCLSESLRQANMEDDKGRKVRIYHSLTTTAEREVGDKEGQRPVQRTLWAHVADASDEFLLESLRQRRSSIRADVVSLRADLDYINELRREKGKRPIVLSFDFIA